MRIAIDTLGCKANRYDSVVIEEALKRGTHEVVSFDQPADVYIVNSCTVTKSADAQTRQLVRRFQRMNPDSIVVVTGCSAQMNPDMYAAMPGVHYVVGSDQKGTIASLIGQAKPTSTSINVVRRKDSGFATLPIKRYADWSRAFIKIQEGCDNFCTFCIIPYSRGRSRSQRPSDVIEQIKVLVDEGYKEVVLTGIDLMSYGGCVDEEVSLDKLVERVLSETAIPRLRVSSIEPNPLTNRLIQLAKDNPNLCPHFHLSIQSCDGAVLEKMRRRYRLKEILETFKTIEKNLPGAFVGIDLIAGFPGETDEAHKTTPKVLKENPWSELHVFP
ncbi:MAG TPA: tRNA (N(6)-L-threonylcarbamoyladenosine(37)-C(2))-methylthiotransferase MtaB, partial [Bdellovibrionota bacterium]|nr:tRNA (N(6)-L-threonylcarbamoyladenosine(37)-C(2))-methylthiotransferase MtaB [Bdellovibrionota bacterium]